MGLELSLPGTHNGIFGWIPPPGLPAGILVELWRELMDIYKQTEKAHSRQSSGASFRSEVMDKDEANDAITYLALDKFLPLTL